MRYSIRRQLGLLAVLTLGFLSVVIFFAAQNYGKNAAETSYDRLLAGAALQIAESTRVQQGEIVANLPYSAFKTLSLAPDDRVFYRITDANGQVLTGYAHLPSSQKAERQARLLAREHSPRPAFFNAEYQGETVRFLLLSKIFTESSYQGEVIIQLGHTFSARQQMAEDISWRATQLIIPTLLVALLLVALAGWLLMRPIERLNRSLAERSPADLSPIALSAPAEVMPLVNTINHFMRQLSSTLDNLKRFTAEAAHQIKTPLAGVSSQAQNALNEEDKSLQTAQLKRVLEACDQLNGTVEKLLEQATLTHRLKSEPALQLNFTKLAQQVCANTAVTALKKGVTLNFEGQDCYLRGDSFSLEQLVLNLLENAIKYSPPSSQVWVAVQPTHDGFLLSVKDQGPGIPDSDKPHVFERFYRSPNNPRAGSGLGLSIAREIALHHHGILKLSDNLPCGLVIDCYFKAHQQKEGKS